MNESTSLTSGLVISDLKVDLGGRRVLHDINIAIRPGSFVGLLGPNGAGKTTLIRAALGLIPLRTGSVTINGEVVRPGHAGLGYVPQRHEFAWEFPISVEQAVLTGRTGQIGLFKRPKIADWQAVNAALTRVGLDTLRLRPLNELSGGQRQRVLIARALATNPTVLLLDEPFTGLDMPAQESLHSVFERLVSEGTSIFMSTHDLLSAIAKCSELVLLNGSVIAHGTPSEVQDSGLWQQTFKVSADNPLLKVLEVVP